MAINRSRSAKAFALILLLFAVFTSLAGCGKDESYNVSGYVYQSDINVGIKDVYIITSGGQTVKTDATGAFAITGLSGKILLFCFQEPWGFTPNPIEVTGEKSGLIIRRTAGANFVEPMISFGAGSSFARKGDGSFWSWGLNNAYQLGDGTNYIRFTPSPANNLNSVAAISAGYYHTVVLQSNGVALAWGTNDYGQVGDGTHTTRSTPVWISLYDVTDVAVGVFHSIALKGDGSVWTWGSNACGQLGIGTAPETISEIIVPTQISGLSNVVAVAAGHEHNIAVKSDGTVWAWGKNNYGQLGDGSITNRNAPVQIAGIDNAVAVAAGQDHSLVIKSDGSIWAWGCNSNGQVGDGTRTDRNMPVQVIGLSDAVAVSAGGLNSIALTNDGRVWTWGDNNSGQIGDGTNTSRNTPTQVSGLDNVVAITTGFCHAGAIKSDGGIWVWGNNLYGQLGIGNTVDRLTPVKLLF